MLRKIKRYIKKNPLDEILKKAKKNNKKTFLLAWNRALGDISLGLYAVVFKIKEQIKDAKITFLIREDLFEGFELLDGIDFITVSFWRRYIPFDIYHTLHLLNIDSKKYDVIIDKVDPNYWVKWQISNLIPKLRWKNKFDLLADKFKLPKNKILIAVQPTIETKHSPWRQYPKKYFEKLFSKANRDIIFVLLGIDKKDKFDFPNVIDLRGKTTLIDALSIIKNRCSYFISLDSGILSLFYFLDVNFSIKLIALWGSKDVGVIKQNVKSPNKDLMYTPLIYEKTLHNLKPEKLLKNIYPLDIEKILKENKQKVLLEKFQKFKISKKKKLIHEIFSIDRDVLKKQKAFLSKIFLSKRSIVEKIHPLKIAKKAKLKDFKVGKKLIVKNKVALIILAAGQGSRLGFDKAKGLFKIENKTLFEHVIEKIQIKQETLKVKLYFSIMTSHLNNDEIIEYFKDNNYFGFDKDQIDFFMQEKAPFLDENANWLFKNDKIEKTSNGNGSIYKSFCESNIYFKYSTKNIKYLSVVPIDNPLLDPFDENFIGFHKRDKNEISIKCMKRETLDEKKGAIGEKNGKVQIVEYINLVNNQNYKYSNSGIYLIDLKFFKKLKNKNLKYHFIKKRVKNSEDIFAYKSESFIFDGFTYANKINTMLDDKQNFYAPIKDKKSLKYVEKLLSLEKANQNVLK
ncbi:MAG: putative uridylyltransferase [Candidatus Anoxychlamydiales bacterium]|nr:putative uridylyltransferase [Candidatus Anoxychlamydiales bacterium]